MGAESGECLLFGFELRNRRDNQFNPRATETSSS